MAVAFQPSERRPAAREAPARRGRWGLRLVAAMGGAAFALAFPAPGLWWWAYIGLVPVLELVSTSPDRREALWRCWSAGCGYFLALYHWLMPSLSVFALPLVLVTGLVWLPWGLVAWWLLRAPRSAGRAAAAIVAVMPGLGTRVRLGAGAGAALLVGGAVAYGLSRPEPDITATLRIGGVQPGVVDDRRERLAAHEDLSRELAATETDVVVWGQSSLGFDLEAEAWARERVLALARELDRPLLVNVDARGPGGRISKTMVVVRPDGLGETYTKQRLVPFGEYIPLRPLLGWVQRLSEAAEEDRVPGTGLTTLRLGAATVGPLVSLRVDLPDMRRRHARAGVDLTLVQAAATTVQGMGVAPAGQLRGGASGRVGSGGRACGGPRYVRGVRRSGAAAHLGRPARDRRVVVAALAAIPLVAVRVARRLLTEPDRFTRGTRVAAGGPVVPVLGAVPPSHRPRLAVLAAIAFPTGLITGPVATLLLVYAENVLDVSSAVTAGLVVAAGLTELAGLMLGRPRRPPRAAADRSPGPDAHGRGGGSHPLRIGAGGGGRASLRGAVWRRPRHIGGLPL